MIRFTLLLLMLAGPLKAEPLKVVTDILPVQSLVSRVFGNLPQVLVEGSADPHDFQFRPSQARALADADLLIAVGPVLLPWLDEQAHAINPTLTVIDLSKGEETHPWLDPETARTWVPAIAQALAKADPDNASDYRARADDAMAELTALTSETDAALAPARTLRLLVGHDAYNAFAARFGLNIVARLSDSEAHEPGAAHLAELAAMVGAGKVDCIFAEPGEAAEFAAVLASADGLTVGELDPLGRTLAPGASLYGNMIRALANNIAACRP